MKALIQLSLTLLTSLGQAQIPYDALSPIHRAEAQDIERRADFIFQTRTEPKRVKVATMEKLFDHPRVGAAMWRHCRFAPTFYAFTSSDGSWSIDDTKGLKGTLRLVHSRPGLRVYLAEGRAEAGRLATPFGVGAKMVTVYRYWEGPKGFESYLQTWTALDSALLGALSKPFRGYIRKRQDEFIAYINGNIAMFGEFATLQPAEFRDPVRREGDPLALRDFDRLFPTKR